MRILFIGDIVGKAGRHAVASSLPGLRKELNPDCVIANVENIAHGTGITRSTLEEIRVAGVDAFTSGNHVWTKPEVLEIFAEGTIPLVRPANFPTGSAGKGSIVIRVGARTMQIINVQGRVFMNQHLDDPFRTFERELSEHAGEHPDAVFVDFHAEVTSEKVAFGLWADGRASAIVGTHTHIGTADQRILPGGTAYITDVGMVGIQNGVLGVDKDVIIKQFLTQQPARHTLPESGTCICNMVCIDIDASTHKATAIQRIDRIVEV